MFKFAKKNAEIEEQVLEDVTDEQLSQVTGGCGLLDVDIDIDIDIDIERRRRECGHREHRERHDEDCD